ncbi:MAG: hypothetical protein WC107_05740 [Patescibacteria group bacterium]|jgi:hypothetical protein
MRLLCFSCGKSVTNELPNDTILRAIATCPECLLKDTDDALQQQVSALTEQLADAEQKLDGYKLMMQSETLEKLDKPELIMIIRDLRSKEYESRLVEASEEYKQLLAAVNSIVDLGLQRLPVDKRWGTAFAIAREAIDRSFAKKGG